MATKVLHPSVQERRAAGKAARDKTPRAALETWQPSSDRPDPVDLLESQNKTREPDLLALRRGRMVASPFTFYRGAAKVMAADLATIPVAGLDVQLCGDAHLSNFGAFASPERALLFDLNDFDETLPGPFEWDVARLAASFTIASRSNGFGASDARKAAAASAAGYRRALAKFADMPTLGVWYSRLDAEEVVSRGIADGSKISAGLAKQAEKNLAKTKSRDSIQALSKLVEVIDGQQRIISDPPVVVPLRDLAEGRGVSVEEAMQQV